MKAALKHPAAWTDFLMSYPKEAAASVVFVSHASRVTNWRHVRTTFGRSARGRAYQRKVNLLMDRATFFANAKTLVPTLNNTVFVSFVRLAQQHV